MSRSWPRYEEPFRRTLARNAAVAFVVGLGLALLRQNLTLFLPFSAVALWPSLGGHYIELAFLNGLRPRIPPGRPTQVGVRLLWWSVGGVLVYFGMAATGGVLPIKGPPLRLWWYGSFLLIGLELVAHVVLAVQGLPNFYDGRG